MSFILYINNKLFIYKNLWKLKLIKIKLLCLDQFKNLKLLNQNSRKQ